MRFNRFTPTERLVNALEALTATAEAVREATADLRVQRADLESQLSGVKAAAERGDKVFENLKALLGE
jgi:hypothetical protein